MPSTATETFRTFFQRRLQRQAGRATAALGDILRQTRDLPASRLEVVLDAEAGPEVPITLYFLDGAGDPLPGSTFDLGRLLGPIVAGQEVETVRRFDQGGVETREVQVQLLIDWFAACWQSAGGCDLPIPACLSIRNDIESLDLWRMAWVPGHNHRSKDEIP